MYCPSCGQEIPNHSKYCLHCGVNISLPKNEPIEWEHEDFTWGWYDNVKRPSGVWGNALGEARVKRDFWDDYQRIFLEQFQKWLDDGWQPISEIGPSALVVEPKKRLFGLDPTTKWELIECRVAMRRPKNRKA